MPQDTELCRGLIVYKPLVLLVFIQQLPLDEYLSNPFTNSSI